MSAPVRVRFAPSPTGLMHVGNARTALFSWLHARHVGGEFVLRIEDTDAERSTAENVEFIFEALAWLGLDYDAPPVFQSQRADRHRELLAHLINTGRAYYSTATKADVDAFKQTHGHDRGFRGEDEGEGAVRLRVPDVGVTVVRDLVRGDARFENRRLDDPVIARADGSPLYNFAAAVDDADMNITHVIRGDDHLSNTPRQLLVMDALGMDAPVYSHLPLLHGPDGKKLAKRHGAASVQELAADGILSEALVNYLALLGWGPDDDSFLSRDELVARFDIAAVTSNPARFDAAKLRWLNGLWVRRLPAAELAGRVAAFVNRPELDLTAAVAASQEKFQTLAEFWPLVAGVYDYPGPLADERAVRKAFKDDASPARLAAVRDALTRADWTPAGVEAALTDLPERFGVSPGKLFQPLRVALTGSTVSPGIFDTACLLSQSEALDRIDATLAALS